MSRFKDAYLLCEKYFDPHQTENTVNLVKFSLP